MKKIPNHYQDAILESVDNLQLFPKCNHLDITRLINHRHGYRMRVGRYRVLFDHEDVIKIINIQEVTKRDDRTY